MELDAFYLQYKSLSTYEGEGGGITKDTYQLCLGSVGIERNLITDRMFDFYDQDGDGIIIFKEFACGLSILCKGSLDERIKCKFNYKFLLNVRCIPGI